MEGDGAVLFFSRALSDGVWGESLGYTTVTWDDSTGALCTVGSVVVYTCTYARLI